MRMEAGLDTGPVAATARTEIRDDDTTGTLGERLGRLGAELLLSVLPTLSAGAASLVPQDDALATLAPPLRKEDGALDFAQPARMVSARARGVDPWPGATARLGDDTVKLFRPEVEELPLAAGEAPAPAPGTIVRIDGRGAAVRCGAGAVIFAELQLPGRTRMSASAAAAGRVIDVGARFS
jgi:methionyl-tRNA formyltransferase